MSADVPIPHPYRPIAEHYTCATCGQTWTLDADQPTHRQECFAAPFNDIARDRAAELVTLARAAHRATVRRTYGSIGNQHGSDNDTEYAIAMLAPFRGSGPSADAAQRHGRYMFGLIVHNFAAYMAEDGRAGDVGPFHPSAER